MNSAQVEFIETVTELAMNANEAQERQAAALESIAHSLEGIAAALGVPPVSSPPAVLRLTFTPYGGN
jgi:HPt (histidine-containing phosphotransfer) domain-containing protein